MTRADWAYELPPATGDSVWLEEYLVYDCEGEPAGKVFHLALSAAEVEDALELDPGRGVEQDGAARRVTDVPPADLPPPRDAGAPGPVDRVVTLAAPLAALLGTLALLAVFIFWGGTNSTDALPFFAVPGVLFAVAAVLAYRAWARPWARNAAAQRHRPPR